MLGHLSKLVMPGDCRIDSNPFGPGGIGNVAFQNPDGSIVLLVLNSGNASAAFATNWSGHSFQYRLPAKREQSHDEDSS